MSLPRGNVEGSCGYLSLDLDCFLYAIGHFFVGYGLVVPISGRYARGLVLVGPAVCIRLL